MGTNSSKRTKTSQEIFSNECSKSFQNIKPACMDTNFHSNNFNLHSKFSLPKNASKFRSRNNFLTKLKFVPRSKKKSTSSTSRSFNHNNTQFMESKIEEESISFQTRLFRMFKFIATDVGDFRSRSCHGNFLIDQLLTNAGKKVLEGDGKISCVSERSKRITMRKKAVEEEIYGVFFGDYKIGLLDMESDGSPSDDEEGCLLSHLSVESDEEFCYLESSISTCTQMYSVEKRKVSRTLIQCYGVFERVTYINKRRKREIKKELPLMNEDKLKELEIKFRPCLLKIQQKNFFYYLKRKEVLLWLIQVHDVLNLNKKSLFLSINVIDRCFSYVSIPEEQIILLVLSSLFVSAKFVDPNGCSLLEDFSSFYNNKFTKEMIEVMESLVLEIIEYKLSIVSYKEFLDYLLCNESEDIYFMSFYLHNISIVNGLCLNFTPFLLAKTLVKLVKLAVAKKLNVKSCGSDECMIFVYCFLCCEMKDPTFLTEKFASNRMNSASLKMLDLLSTNKLFENED